MEHHVWSDHGSHCELYVHLIWTTWNREPLLEGELKRAIYACIRAECSFLHAEVLALNGAEDHVHLCLRVRSTTLVATVAKQVKGASSHLATHKMKHEGFKWQEGYASFTVSRWDVPNLVSYIEHQEEHHRDNTTRAILEPTC